jgi:exopolysaccharide production protein ExoZ
MAKKYVAIQVLRFVAATFVVIDQSIADVVQGWSNTPQLNPIAWSAGEVGVIVFFGISGFIMATTQYESFGSAERSVDFFVRRIMRIVPIYAIATTLEYLHRTGSGETYSLLNYVRSLLFIPYLGEGGLFRPILGQGWTLNYEMFFYLVFAASLSLRRPIGFALSTSVFLLLALLSGVDKTGNVVVAFYLNHILLYFVCGMMVGFVTKHQAKTTSGIVLPTLLAVLLMVIACALKITLQQSYFLAGSLIAVCACVYLGASCAPVGANKLRATFERLGDASYSTYLFHGFFLGTIRFLVHWIADAQYVLAVMFVLLCIVVANLGGLLVFKFVELPISKFLHRHHRFFVRAPSPS